LYFKKKAMAAQGLVKIFREEETIRREVVRSAPFVYTETLIEHADAYVFGKHPYGRYVAGAFGGLFINSVVRR
jgi:hypothetical protein